VERPAAMELAVELEPGARDGKERPLRAHDAERPPGDVVGDEEHQRDHGELGYRQLEWPWLPVPPYSPLASAA
jgi:hypothetical protein